MWPRASCFALVLRVNSGHGLGIALVGLPKPAQSFALTDVAPRSVGIVAFCPLPAVAPSTPWSDPRMQLPERLLPSRTGYNRLMLCVLRGLSPARSAASWHRHPSSWKCHTLIPQTGEDLQGHCVDCVLCSSPPIKWLFKLLQFPFLTF